MRRPGALQAAAAFFLAAAPAFASEFGSGARGTGAGEFLKLGVGARAEAMGEAHAAAADDASSLYWNPAALARAGSSAVFMHAPYVDKSFYDYAAYSQPLGEGAAGLGLQYFTAGALNETDATGTTIGTFRPYALALSAGYARSWSGISWGLSGKLIREQIVANAHSLAVDLGALKEGLVDGRLAVGATLTNLGQGLRLESERYDLPMAFRIGGAYRVAGGLLAAMDAIFARDDGPQGAFGVEYRQGGARWWALRGGYRTGVAADAGGLAGASFGGGLGFGSLSVDYAFMPLGGLGYTHRISLGWRIGPRPEQAAQASPDSPVYAPVVH